MKHLMTVLALSVACLSTSAIAASHKEAPMMAASGATATPMAAPMAAPMAGSCDAKAADKKLAGAAKTSFVKKCEKDAMPAAATACNSQAADKKLAGAAKNSFVKKCVADASK